MRSEWQTHQGKRYYYCNYANLGLEELQVEMDAVDWLIGQQPEGSVLILTDVRGLSATPKVVDMFKKSTALTKNHIRRSAVVGTGFSGPRKVLFDIVMRFSGQKVVVFEDIEEARNWLMDGS